VVVWLKRDRQGKECGKKEDTLVYLLSTSTVLHMIDHITFTMNRAMNIMTTQYEELYFRSMMKQSYMMLLTMLKEIDSLAKVQLASLRDSQR